MKLYAKDVVSGGIKPLNLSDNPTQQELDNAIKQLADAQHIGPFILSNDPPPKDELVPASLKELIKPKLLHSLDDGASGLPTPTPPKPTSPTNLPVGQSDELIVSTSPVTGLYVKSIDTGAYLSSNFPGLQPAFPQTTYMQLSTYWKQVGLAVLVGPQTYTHTVSFEKGMSSTDSTTLSAELGVSLPHLSAKISSTTSHSVTTSEATTITDSYELKIEAGKTTVYVLWQLMVKLLFLDKDLTPVVWNGDLNIGKKIPLTFPNEKRISMFNTVFSDPTTFKT